MTTAEKIQLAINELQTLKPADMPADVRELMDTLQILQGATGFDPLTMFIPANPEDADVIVDKALTFLLQLRGDDLPPFDFGRYGEAEPSWAD